MPGSIGSPSRGVEPGSRPTASSSVGEARSILRDPDASPTLAVLLDVLPVLAARLKRARHWAALRIRDPESGLVYERLAGRARLEVCATGRVYRLAIHRFGGEGPPGAMHDHRFPIAVLPLAAAPTVEDVLYEMPWRDRELGTSGRILVRDGESYAIERASAVLHAVHGRGPHLSVVVSDETEPPLRELRLEWEPMRWREARALRRAGRLAIEAHQDRPERPVATRSNGPG
ncbi:MAG: hypothetical protein R3F20_02355 [Planctomycetota bacterium]